MKMYRKILTIVLLAVLVSALIPIPAFAADITVATDQASYTPDSLVTITGTSDGTVGITVTNPSATNIYTAIAVPAAGSYSSSFRLPVDAALGTYTVDVSTTGSTAETTFTVSTGIPEPDTGTLSITTTPVNGEVSVNGILWGTAPQSDEVEVGSYTVSFGAMTGYDTPANQTVDVTVDATKDVTGTYVLIPVQPDEPANTTGEQMLDSTGAPATSFAQGETVLASAEVSNIGIESQIMLIVAQLKDPDLRVLPPIYIGVTLAPGQSITPSIGFLLQTTGYTADTWTATIMVFDAWPAQGAVPLGSAVTISFTVTE